ncbi:MAG: acyl carrier protein [Bacillota bacterium]|nr:acyl carrier protein [Bacillota bacterium]
MMEFEKIRDIIVEQFGVDEDSVALDTAFKDLGDSMDLIELIMSLEEEFDLEIADEDVDEIKTVNDAVEYIKSNS